MAPRFAQFRISLFPWVRIREIENSNELPRCPAINLHVCLSPITLISTGSSQLHSLELNMIGSKKANKLR